MSTRRCITSAVVGFTVIACGSTEPTPEPLESPPVDLGVVAACARMLSCPPASTHGSLSECVLVNAGPRMETDGERIVTGFNALGDRRSALRACINDALADCDRIRFCSLGQSGPCVPLPEGGATCEGNRYVFCRHATRNEIDCTTNDCERAFSCDTQPRSEACIILADGRAGCGREACSEAEFVRKCDGDAELICMAGLVKRYPCSGACGTKPDGSEGCLPPPPRPSCSPDAPPHCEGLDRVSCIQGREFRDSCGGYPVPQECTTNEPCGASAPCVECIPSARLRCDPRKHVDRCTGTNLTYCDGQERVLDCRILGFGGCVENERGASCTP